MAIRTAPPTERRAVAVLDTFVAGIGERASAEALARLRAGAAVDLRPAGAAPWRRRVEVWSRDGRPLGYLPPDDAVTLADATALGASVASARVTAVIPAFQRSRIQLRIVVGPA